MIKFIHFLLIFTFTLFYCQAQIIPSTLTLPPKITLLNNNSLLLQSQCRVSQKWKEVKLNKAFFCKLEDRFANQAKYKLSFRLGGLDYCNKMEYNKYLMAKP